MAKDVAKDVAKGAANDAAQHAAQDGAEASEESEQPGEPEDEVRRRFREALERKQSRGDQARGPQHADGRGVGPASNDKRQRQFRRKSG